jgi:hypothetical protein
VQSMTSYKNVTFLCTSLKPVRSEFLEPYSSSALEASRSSYTRYVPL